MASNDDINWLKEQMVDLQSQLAFQEDTLKTLNSVVTRQQQQLEQLNELCHSQKNQLELLANEVEGGGVEERPPHY